MKNSQHPEHPVDSWARIDVLHRLYWKMCERAYSAFLESVAKYEAIQENQDPIAKMELEDMATAHGIETIVFAGLCLEAAIYDYAAVQLSDDYVQEHFDKMDLVSKWIVIPRLVCGLQIRKGAVPYARLKKLVKSRNSLVHHKSREFRPTKEQLEKQEKDNIEFEDSVHNAYRALVMLSLEMDDIVGPLLNPLPTFSEEVISTREIQKPLNQVIGQCKHVYKRSQAKS